MGTVKRLHFVCRNDMNVKVLSDGRVESGFWKVAAKNAKTAAEIYLHQSKGQPSYRQGRIIERPIREYRGHPRFVFIFEPFSTPQSWEGDGTGEKGYGYESHSHSLRHPTGFEIYLPFPESPE